MSDSVQPHRRQPTRLPRPWDSPGKNTGVGCHFLLQCMKVKSESEVAQSCPTPSDPMDCSLPGSSVHGIFQARALEWGAIAFSVIHLTDVLIVPNWPVWAYSGVQMFLSPMETTLIIFDSFLTFQYNKVMRLILHTFWSVHGIGSFSREPWFLENCS